MDAIRFLILSGIRWTHLLFIPNLMSSLRAKADQWPTVVREMGWPLVRIHSPLPLKFQQQSIVLFIWEDHAGGCSLLSLFFMLQRDSWSLFFFSSMEWWAQMHSLTLWQNSLDHVFQQLTSTSGQRAFSSALDAIQFLHFRNQVSISSLCFSCCVPILKRINVAHHQLLSVLPSCILVESWSGSVWELYYASFSNQRYHNPILTFHPQSSLARLTDMPGSVNAFIKILWELVCAAQMPGIKYLIDDNSDWFCEHLFKKERKGFVYSLLCFSSLCRFTWVWIHWWFWIWFWFYVYRMCCRVFCNFSGPLHSAILTLSLCFSGALSIHGDLI